MSWQALKQSYRVTEVIFRLARCKNGAKNQIYKQTQLLSYDERLENLCDPHRQRKLTIVETADVFYKVSQKYVLSRIIWLGMICCEMT